MRGSCPKSKGTASPDLQLLLMRGLLGAGLCGALTRGSLMLRFARALALLGFRLALLPSLQIVHLLGTAPSYRRARPSACLVMQLNISQAMLVTA